MRAVVLALVSLGLATRRRTPAIVLLLPFALLVAPKTASAQTEFHICSDVSTQGAGQPCEQSICLAEEGTLVAGVVGGACTSAATSISGPVSALIRYEFNTGSPSGTPFVLWQRLVADASWDAGEQYDCSLSGVTGVGTTAFSIVEVDLGSGALGLGCSDISNFEQVCWATATGLSSIALDQGGHVLECVITLANPGGGIEAGGFDGFIFTSDLSYVPDEQDTACGDDAIFEAGTCFGNWGPNLFYPLPNVPTLGTWGVAIMIALLAGSALLIRPARIREPRHDR